MESFVLNGLEITLNKKGSQEFSKVSYPVRYGIYSEIKTNEYLYQFNLNGEIKYIMGLGDNRPNNLEWLKRTISNNWVYYSTGGYEGVFDLIGEYYFPCLSYPSNAVFGGKPFKDKAVTAAIESCQQLLEKIQTLKSEPMPASFKKFLKKIIKNNGPALEIKAESLHSIIKSQISVLPPDTRHVDYEIIPVIIADGCLYNCGFCRVKSGQDFHARSKKNILEQLNRLRDFYGEDIKNYNAIFIGQHDALHAGWELIEFTAKNAYRLFEFKNSYLKNPALFLFGSIDSILGADDNLFYILNKLPFYTYINLGLESGDQETLDLLKKPVNTKSVKKAFNKMLWVNMTFENIEITANFVFGKNLYKKHYESFLELTNLNGKGFYSKGAVYLSPLNNSWTKQEAKEKFRYLKSKSRMETLVYLIQRL